MRDLSKGDWVSVAEATQYALLTLSSRTGHVTLLGWENVLVPELEAILAGHRWALLHIYHGLLNPAP